MTSNLSAFRYFQERDEATPALFNDVFSKFSSNIAAVDSNASFTVLSGQTISISTNLEVVGGGHFQHLSIGSTPPSYLTTAAVTIEVNSNQSDYLYLVDSAAQRSSYIIGSRAGGLADGLNIWDASAGTMIASFSKQSIRFFQNVVGPVFDTGGALASTYNAATFIGSGSSLSGIQAAINQASTDGIARVYVPASMYPYDASKISFITTVQMVREGGDWSVYDVWAYGAKAALNIPDAWSTAAIQAALDATANTGKVVYVPAGSYAITGLSVYSSQILRGTGTGQQGASQFYQGSANTSMVRPKVPANPTQTFTIEDLTLSCFGNIANMGVFDAVNFLQMAARRVKFSGGSQFNVRAVGGSHIGDSGFGNIEDCFFTATQAGATDFLMQSTTIDQPDAMTLLNCYFNSDYSWLGSVATLGVGAGSLRVIGSRFETTATKVSIISGWLSDAAFLGNRFETTGSNATLGVTLHPSTLAGTTPCAVFIGNTYAAQSGISWIDTGYSKSVRWGDNETGPILRNELQDGSVLNPAWSFRSESSLGWYRSAASAMALSYGQLQVPSATVLLPALGYSSESSLGWYRSANSTMELSYGTLVVPLASTFMLRGANAAEVRVFESGNVGYLTFNLKPSFAQDHTGLASWTLEANYNATGKLNFIHNNPAGGVVPVASLTSVGQWLLGAGIASFPSLTFSSESSLGFFRSASSTMALSYGTIDLTASGAVTSIASLTIKSGSNNACGTAVLGSNGSVNVANTYVKTGDLIFLTDQTPGGTLGDLELLGIRNSSGFTIGSTSITDTSTVAWLIVRPG